MLKEFKLHHIGIAVPEIDPTASLYIEGGYSATEQVYDSIQKVHICFLTKEGMPTLELIAPAQETSPVFQILKKNGVIPYHFCYEVENVEDSIEKLRGIGYLPITKPIPAIAIDGKRVCFLYHKKIGLVELVESKK